MPPSTTYKELRSSACSSLEKVVGELSDLELSLIKGRKRDVPLALRTAVKEILAAVTLLRVPGTMKKERAA